MLHSDVICESGYPKPLMNATLGDKDELIRSVFLHQTIYRCLAELDQLKEGLNVVGMTDEMTKHPDAFFDFFTYINRRKLTAGLYSYSIILNYNVVLHLKQILCRSCLNLLNFPMEILMKKLRTCFSQDC